MRLKDKVVIVTGAARGIGEAYVHSLCAEGAKVCIADILDKEGQKVAGDLTDKGAQAFFAHTDITDETNFQDTVRQTISKYGGVDALVNNAALYGGMGRWDALTGPIDYFNRMMTINVTGVLIGARAVAPHMIERKKGSIVNQSSITAYFSGGAYGTSKLAVIGLTIGLATQLGPQGVRVNAIAPGFIWTEASLGVAGDTPEAKQRFMGLQTIKKLGQPEDLCGALLFLVSDESAWMNGETMVVDGGWMRRV